MLGERLHNGCGSGSRCSELRTGYGKRLKMAGAAASVMALFALMAVMGTADRAWAAVCGGTLINATQQPAGTANDGPFLVGTNVTISATIENSNATTFTVTNFQQLLSCQNTTLFSSCTTADDSSVSYVGNITTTCGVTWNAVVSGNNVTFTPTSTLTLAVGGSCKLAFDVSINNLGVASPGTINEANEFTGACNTGGTGTAGGAVGGISYGVVQCGVEIDKQVSCDGGTTWLDVSGADDTEPPTLTLSDLCIGWDAFNNGTGITPATNIEVRYKARNTGTVDATCNTGDTYPGAGGGAEGLTDTNLGILAAGTSVASIPASQTTYVQVVGPETVACSDTLAASEPDTAALKCQCAVPAGPTFAAPITMDSAKFACQTPGLGVTKTCGAADGSGNAPVTVTYESNGTAALGSCTLTDTVFAGPCVNGLPSSSTVVGSVTGIPGSLTDPTSSPTKITGLTATGLNSTSCDGADCCNQATVTCDVTGSPGPETIAASNTADCPIASGDCFTRTPGFWGTHTKSQDLLYADFGPVSSCGVDLDTSAASTQGSGTEDICSIGGGKSNPPQSTISNTQRQLERQCAAANMNLAVSNLRDVSCEAAFPGITTLIDNCCNAADSVCNTGGDTTGCIGALDAFNNFDFTTTVGSGSVDATDFGPPGANPKQCQAAKASGFVNKRPRP